MKYNSTRGGVTGCTFEEGIFSPGYQADGGLLLPERIPSVSLETLKTWQALSFPDLCKEIMSLFIIEEEIPRNDLNEIIDKAYAKLPLQEIVKIKDLEGDLKINEMFLCRTLAFKDLSTFVLGEILSYFLQRRKKHIVLVIGTSGDTGASCLEAVKGLQGIYIIVLLPSGRISDIQERSMTTAVGDNIHIYAVDGTCDDLDATIKSVSLDQEFRRRHNLCTMNSVNIGRILCSITPFFYAYLQLFSDCDKELEVVLPTGSGGNIASGYIARLMGLPVRFVCTVNKNDIYYRLLTEGDFSVRDDVIPTLSPAIDIQNPYNVERLFWLFSGQDCKQVKEIMEAFEANGKVTIPTQLLKKINECVTAYRCTDVDVKSAMQKCWVENQYLVCPHTAIAVSYYYSKQSLPEKDRSSDPSIVFATASPAKFPEAVTKAGLTPVCSYEVERWLSLPTQSVKMNIGENWQQMLRNKVEEFTNKFESQSVNDL